MFSCFKKNVIVPVIVKSSFEIRRTKKAEARAKRMAEADTVKKLFTPTGDTKRDKERGELYLKLIGINSNLPNQDHIKQVYEQCNRDYDTMKAMYGGEKKI